MKLYCSLNVLGLLEGLLGIAEALRSAVEDAEVVQGTRQVGLVRVRSRYV